MNFSLNIDGLDLSAGLTITAVELLESDAAIDLSAFDDITIYDDTLDD